LTIAQPSPPSLHLPRLRADQWAIAQHPAKVKVLSMGRRWGKTVLGRAISLATAAAGGKVAWCVPAYKNGRPLWREAEFAVAPLKKAGLCRVNRGERTIEFPNGGFLGIYSMDNEGSIRGESFHLVILDEAAMMSETAWTDAIQPTLADFDGDAILISTPKGRNWFWHEWMRGQDGAQAAQRSWKAPTASNPSPLIQKAAALARTRVATRTYEQEWLAEFVEDGALFRRVRESATATPQERALPGHQYVIGADWGKLADFTAFSVIDLATLEEVALDRFNQIDYTVQIGRLKALCERFNPELVLAERNSIGEPVIEQAQREGLPVQPFVTTNATKAAIVEALALAFERATFRILPDETALGELLSFEATRLPSGLLRYSAPDGMHDDTVIARALALHAAETGEVGYMPSLWS
jgi:phage terminase large subunit-like protein